MSRTGGGIAPSLFLTLAVATSLAIGSVGYISGSAPEWIVLKASIGLLSVGLVGWLVSALMSATPNEHAVKTQDVVEAKEAVKAKGRNLDVTLAEAAPVDQSAGDTATSQSAKR